MSAWTHWPLDRLAFPRSRRTQLWTCVYCATFDDGPPDATETEPPRAAD